MKKGGGGRVRAVTVVLPLVTALVWVLPMTGARVSVAGAAGIPTGLTCSASSSLGVVATSEQVSLEVTGAPVRSLPGKTFTLEISDPGQMLPATLDGYPVTGASTLQIAYPVPDGATFVSATATGGSGVGNGATVAEAPDFAIPTQTDVVETVPGPIVAGQSFSLPTIDLTITTSAPVGTTITTGLLDVQPTGQSIVSSDPALSMTLNVAGPQNAPIAVGESCWPMDPVPTALSSTTVVAVDTTPPEITLTSPENGAVYTVGQVVDAAYGCTDVASYGVSTCNGPVPSGSPVDTSTVGEQSFTVNATDLRGTPAQKTVSYYVKAPQATNVIGPADAGPVQLQSGTSCSFGGSGCPMTAAPEATYEVASPVPNGGTLVMGDSFFVQWQIYEPGTYSPTGDAGPLLNWTVPAPIGTVIDGPVTTSAVGLLSPAVGQGSLADAGACTVSDCSARTSQNGILSVNGVAESGSGWAYDAANQSAISLSWDESSNPGVGTDGLYLDVSYTLKVTTPGTVTLSGFPALTSPSGLSTAPIDPPSPAVTFTVLDPTPPSASVAAPLDGGIYDYGQAVVAAYTCSDPVVVITSCTGTVPDGGLVDTTSAVLGGIHTFTVTATDSVGNTATSQVEYYVKASPPDAIPQSFSVPWGASANLPVLSSDTAGNYPLDPSSIVILKSPSDGTATPNPDGTVTFTDNPNVTFANYLQTHNLDDSFTYTVSDVEGNQSNVATVSLTVLPQLVVSSLPPAVTTGLTLQQTAEQPTDPLGVSDGSSCTGSPMSLNGQAQGSCGEISPVAIINNGGANAGWSLSGQVSDFLDPAAPPTMTCDSPGTYDDLCIPGGDLGWIPSGRVVSVLPGSGSVLHAGEAVRGAPEIFGRYQLPWPDTVSAPGSTVAPPSGLHDAPQVLCQSPAGASEGWFVCGAALTLPVPASSAASAGPGYEATLTLTLVLS